MGKAGLPKLQARDVSVVFLNERTGTRTHALQDITLDVYDEEFVAIVGPSGCGKTTLKGRLEAHAYILDAKNKRFVLRTMAQYLGRDLVADAEASYNEVTRLWIKKKPYPTWRASRPSSRS